jgi:sugar lactone lactonase YvrE
LDLKTGEIVSLNMGEPEPVNIAAGPNGQLYWTCKTAGVILERDKKGNVTQLLTGLNQPNGIAAGRSGAIYFTLLPTPGVPGSQGGMNSVNLLNGSMITTLTTGEPEPTDITVSANGNAYWTCKSAGVIQHRAPDGTVRTLLRELNKPTGIALSGSGKTLYFTEVPTPAVPGSMGGENAVWQVDLATLEQTLVDAGDPQPTDITVAHNGRIYWTCTSAGVIVEASRAHP